MAHEEIKHAVDKSLALIQEAKKALEEDDENFALENVCFVLAELATLRDYWTKDAKNRSLLDKFDRFMGVK